MSAAPSNESAVAVRILAELPVPAQATTSRVVINNDVLRVVLFAMDTGQELTDHASPRAVTVQILEGEVQFSVGDVVHDLSGGDVVYLAPNERHALLAQSPCRFSLVMVDLKQ